MQYDQTKNDIQRAEAAQNIATEIGLIMLAAIAGAAIGLLFAPASGKETRKEIKTLFTRMYDKMNDSIEDSAKAVRKAAKQTSRSFDQTIDEIHARANSIKKNLNSKFN